MPIAVMSIARIFLLGVAVRVVFADQSQAGLSSDEQMEATGERKGQLETPAVVLQLKYDRGELNRIYLAQFRNGKKSWAPSVEARSDLCADLCHAGLGGEACGPSCDALMPVGLKTALANATEAEVEMEAQDLEPRGAPRVSVCPSLCKNQLGQPLCTCTAEPTEDADVNWSAICNSFCESDNYVLRGCPSCEKTTTKHLSASIFSARTLSTAEGWTAWCNVQCRQGHGGAACNCDRAPM